ncbi:MAG: DotU family type IV/VI secretion system protein [Acidobacteriota bacterium]|nr:DotU family type IV/VI secretion system protein [Acidobacteriota bacterium]
MRRPDNLALIFQEALTAIVRVGSNQRLAAMNSGLSQSGGSRPMSADALRTHFMNAIKNGEQEARRAGYVREDVKLSIFALVAMLDEAVLSSANSMFADWHKQPLALQLFSTALAGEIYFENIENLLQRDESQDLADLLEIYYLGLLIGFSGRYHSASAPELGSKKHSLASKIHRIRGGPSKFSPGGDLPGAVNAPLRSDAWVRRLLIAAAACLALYIVLFAAFQFDLSSGTGKLRDLAAQIRQ